MQGAKRLIVHSAGSFHASIKIERSTWAKNAFVGGERMNEIDLVHF